MIIKVTHDGSVYVKYNNGDFHYFTAPDKWSETVLEIDTLSKITIV